MRLSPYPYRALARWGDTVVAQSDRCLSLESDAEPAILCFPSADIDFGLFRDGGRAHGSLGEAEVQLWSIDGAPAPPDEEAWSSPDRPSAATDGTDVLWTYVDPPPDFAPLAGYGSFDQARVRIEVVDRAPGDEERDVTVKRFPTWGDASHLIEILDVRHDGDAFVSTTRDNGRRPVVEGSQMLGQTIVAAGRLAPDRRAVSAEMVFMRPADARRPLRIELEELSAGRQFSTLAAKVFQEGRCCAAGTLLLGAPAEDVIRHTVEAPAVPGPYESPPFDMGVTGRDLRVVDGAYTNTSNAPAGPPTIDAWVKFRSVPDDPALHAGLLAQFTGHMPIAAALRPHAGIGQDQAHRTISMGINSINLSLHRAVRADHWMLYHHLSTFAGDGMTHSEGRVHDEEGQLVASFTVEAMVRAVPGGGTLDDRSAL
jgi:acyl-CoA thioesterase-2